MDRKKLLMMKILRESGIPLSSRRIMEELHARGMDISERTVRFHLKTLDQLGMTTYMEKKGRFLTPAGLNELSKARAYDRVGFLSSRIDYLTYNMSFDPAEGRGTVIVNLTLIDKKDRDKIVPLINPVFSAGLAHGKLLALFNENESVGDIVVPDGRIGLGTVCSITFNGALLNAGIPVSSIFGGLLDIHEGVPDRFTEIIRYDGTSIDPLEIFITSRMTDALNASLTGNGPIGASFREIPSAALEDARRTDMLLKDLGLGGVLDTGYPGQPFLDIPVADQRCGMVISGGLNAVAPLTEKGVGVDSHALSAMIDFSSLFYYEELPLKLSSLN